jgi:nicotinamide mononucleotide transporter
MTEIRLVVDYFFNNYIEILATITGFVYLIFSIKGKKLLWPFGLLTSLLYVYVFFTSRIYADMSINIYYVVVSVYGWVHWSSNKNLKSKELLFSRIKLKDILILGIITLLLFIIIAYILTKYTDSDVAIIDALLTAASITATWMLARKILEHWIIWVFVDSISIGLYVYKGLFPTVILFLFYTILAVVGYFEWLKLWKIQENH